MSTRNWSATDRVAVRDRIDAPWQLGTVSGIQPADYVVVRFDGNEQITIRHPDDPRMVHEHDVPADERHWLTQDERDQLMRQQAATQLRAMWDALPLNSFASPLDIADELEDPAVDADRYAAAARALLNPAQQPATSP
jgi:hypothetical protein